MTNLVSAVVCRYFYKVFFSFHVTIVIQFYCFTVDVVQVAFVSLLMNGQDYDDDDCWC